MTTKEQKQRWYRDNREISIQRAKQYWRDHPEWAKEVSLSKNRSEFCKTWRSRNPEVAKELALHTAFLRRFKKHGLTLDQYHALAEQQDFCCAVCGEEPTNPPVRSAATTFDNFVIDHDHQTGRVRALVCSFCNVAIGMIRENPDTARKIISYLEKHCLPSHPS